MKNLVKICIVIFITMLNSALYSQKNIFAEIGFGFNIPAIESEFKDSYNIGFHIGASGGYLVNDMLATRGSVYYKNFTGKDLPAGWSASFNSVTFSGDVLIGNFKKSSNISPYGFIGFVTYFLSSTVEGKYNYSYYTYSFKNTDSDTKFGIELGVGMTFKVSNNIGIFSEGLFNYIFNEGTAKGYIPIRTGIKFTF